MGPSGCWPLPSPILWDVVLSLKISKAPPHWRKTFTSSHHNATDSTFPPIRISAPGRTNLPSLLTSRIFYHLSFLYHSSLLDHSHQQLTSVNSFVLKKKKTLSSTHIPAIQLPPHLTFPSIAKFLEKVLGLAVLFPISWTYSIQVLLPTIPLNLLWPGNH